MNTETVAQRGRKSKRQAAAMPSDTFGQMLGPKPRTEYTERSARPAEVEL